MSESDSNMIIDSDYLVKSDDESKSESDDLDQPTPRPSGQRLSIYGHLIYFFYHPGSTDL